MSVQYGKAMKEKVKEAEKRQREAREQAAKEKEEKAIAEQERVERQRHARLTTIFAGVAALAALGTLVLQLILLLR